MAVFFSLKKEFKMKLFASAFIADELSLATGCEALPLLPYDKLDSPVSTHADMLVFSLGNKIFCYEDYYKCNEKIFLAAEKSGYEIVKIAPASSSYPNDIALNVLKIGNFICGNLKYVAKEILDYASSLNLEMINVNQGYSACSTLVLDENTAITADKSIFDALTKAGKNVTLISEGGITLEGYNYGFIGGASCVVGDTVYFFGDIKNHQNYSEIHKTISSLEMKEISISCGDVFDFGGARAF